MMKLIKFCQFLSSLVLVAVYATESCACGPSYPIIPTPEFFGFTGMPKNMSEYEREENLRLWQSLTSANIPLADIEEVVYRDSKLRFQEHTGHNPVKTGNQFYIYLNNSGDTEITKLLCTAKDMEERWRNFRSRSPWYYPRKRGCSGDTGDFNDIVTECKSYNGVRLKDRYALQVTRALFASRDYTACIEYVKSAFANIPDSNLMKRMAQRYMAGCCSRLGDKDRADSIFATAGDIWSLSVDDPVEYMAERNPNAPQLIDYIRKNVNSTLFMRELHPVAMNVLKNADVACRGDWHFVVAYIDNELNNNKSSARQNIHKALRQKFSSDELKNMAYAYKMKLDAQVGDMSNLVADLKWIESKTDLLNSERELWTRRAKNIIYADWVPLLWDKKDFSTAILLCAYADNLAPSVQWQGKDTYEGKSGATTGLLNISDMRKSKKYTNHIDYGCLSFQMMGSLSSASLASAYNRILSDTPLYTFLRRKARTDKDYYYELIGTLALREENYSRAVIYLSKVSEHYLKTMNIDKGGYLSRNPFTSYPSRWKVEKPYYTGGEPWETEHQATKHPVRSNPHAKLDFALRMQTYKWQMTNGLDSDERGLARMMYAIGRRNSFEECWALTQYWRSRCNSVFEPDLQYWDDDFSQRRYAFLYDYEETIGHKATEELYDNELKASLAMLTSKEAKARAQFTLNNLKTIIKYYRDTSVGRYIKTSCDNWQSWL